MPEPNPKGIYCPSCRGVRLEVYATRHPAPGLTVRYRECSACNTRLVTEERVSVCRGKPRRAK
jgi:transcriptional regulator NrdR family protein